MESELTREQLWNANYDMRRQIERLTSEAERQARMHVEVSEQLHAAEQQLAKMQSHSETVSVATAAETLKAAIRKSFPGSCRMLSLGATCNCLLCQVCNIHAYLRDASPGGN